MTLSVKDSELLKFFVEKILELSSNFRLYMREIIFGGSGILDKFDNIFNMKSLKIVISGKN